MSLVNLGKLNKAQALAALFNHAKTQGMGVLHYNQNHVMAEAEAKAVLAEGPYVDYLEGRVIKIDFDKYGENQIDVTQYNRDNGAFAAQDALKVAEYDLDAGLISKLNIPPRFMGQELKKEHEGLYYYENILGGVLYVGYVYSIKFPMYEVYLRYVNNENFKERYTMWRGDEKQFRLEGLTRLMMRIMRYFLAAYAEFEKGEEK